MSTPPRETVSHYRLIETLGRGAMGEVWLADDTRLPRQVAVKLLPEHLADDPESVQRLQREASAAASVDHPAVVSIYEAGIEDGQPYIVMQRVEGATLEQRLDKGPMPIDDAINLGITIADALAEVHALGIVHRDLKPANIVMSARGPRILDFGVASVKGSSRMTQTGAAIGTPATMSPEQVRGLTPDNRSDLWALGVILYQALTGRLPFKGGSMEAIAYQVLSEQPPDPSSARAEVSRDLEYVVMKLLRKEAESRYGRAEDVIADLRNCLGSGERPVPAAAESAIPRVAVMYFEVLSADPDDAFLAAGLTDDLIVDLTRVEGVHVASRTDVQAYRERSVPPRTLAREINVSYVLTGSVRRAGNRARISAELVRASDGHTMWAERFDRTLEDLFDVQAEVSNRIVEALQVALKPGEKEILDRKPSASPEAYTFYLQAREIYRYGKAENRRAEVLLQRSIELDANFALGLSALGECHAWRGMHWWSAPARAADEAERYAQRALELDPDLTEAKIVMTMVHRLRGEKELLLEGLKEAQRLDPDNVQALEWTAWSYMTFGEYEKAIAILEPLVKRRPDRYIAAAYLSNAYKILGRLEESREAERRSFEAILAQVDREPGDALARAYLALKLAREGRTEEVKVQGRMALDLAPDDGRTLYNVACAYAVGGLKQEAMDLLVEATKYLEDFITDWPAQDPDLETLRDLPEFKRLFPSAGAAGRAEPR